MIRRSLLLLAVPFAVCCGGKLIAVDAGADAGRPDAGVLPPNFCETDLNCTPADAGTDGGPALPKCDTARSVCVGCLTDPDCGPGRLCHAKTCVVGCSLTHACAAGQLCCAGACLNVSADLFNCGACNNVCPPLANGTRVCGGGRCGLGACTPPYLDCDADPATGCEVEPTTAEHCGSCNPCPGATVPSARVTCLDAQARTCAMSCHGENYDVDGDPANGCERADELGGHTLSTAADLWGSLSCNDGASSKTFVGHVISDARVHDDPVVDGFDVTLGSTPDIYVVHASGGVCQNDYAVAVTTTGGGSIACYRVTLSTDKKTQSMLVAGTGTQSMLSGSGSYSDNSTLFFSVEKVCSLPTQEAVTYSVSFHL